MFYIAYPTTAENAAAETPEIPANEEGSMFGDYKDFASFERNVLRRKGVSGQTYIVLLVLDAHEAYPLMVWRGYHRRTL